MKAASGHYNYLPFVILVIACVLATHAFAQTESATLSGRVMDQSGAIIQGVSIKLIDIDRGTTSEAKTNGIGLYVFSSVHPGRYRMEVQGLGFKLANVTGLIINVQDHIEQNFRLQVGSVAESMTVEGGAPLVNTTDGSVSTVVDRKFVENMPLNGRSFQTLIALTPGVVLTPSSLSTGNLGQFSVNGQRADANYFTVDGASANIGLTGSSNLGQTAGGALPGFSAQGGTNSLVSVDAMQEFRVQTSSFAPEFGRTPGGQISIITRSGTNQFHGTAFEYFRNDVLDASDWFTNRDNLRKPRERQNDFGGLFGGPIIKDKTFFFLSYEGLRLRQPLTQSTVVPSTTSTVSRQSAPPALQPFLNAYPLPNGPNLLDAAGNPTGFAPFNASYSNPSSLDAYSIRADHVVNSKLNLFGRYNYSPSETSARGPALSTIGNFSVKVRTLTIGLTQSPASNINNQVRVNYSNERAGNRFLLDNFGGAVPLTDSQLPFPSGFSSANSELVMSILGAQVLGFGKTAVNRQRQVNLLDDLSGVLGAHQLKFGVDYRYLAPQSSPLAYLQAVTFSGMSGPTGAVSGVARTVNVQALQSSALLLRNFSLYGQDTWKITPRLTLTYGLRWDINPALKGKNSDSEPFTVQNLNNPGALTLAPRGTPLYKTTYGNVGPRFGVAYQLRQNSHWDTTIRGGFGVFYDLGSGSLGQIVTGFPFTATKSLSSVLFPLTPAQTAPPTFSQSLPVSLIVVTDPNLALPRTYQWNVAAEESLGVEQSFSMTYVGAVGRKLLRRDFLFQPNTSFTQISVTRNTATSDYHALQVKFQRRFSRGLEALASYTWSHSIDIASDDANTLNAPPALGVALDRGNSDFDVRHSLVGALTYDVPSPRAERLTRAILGGWSLDNLIAARSALPVNVLGTQVSVGGVIFTPRPNLVSGVPLYLFGPQFPGGRAFNKDAFVNPPTGQQGNFPRNVLRSFGVWQDDFTLRRQFHLTETIGLQFRAEFFNIFNHPNFGNPVNTLSSPLFGQSTQTLASSLGSGGLNGGFNPLYQIGGPRSIQFALKLQF